MATIKARRVETSERATNVVAALRARGTSAADMQEFYVNPPGQHHTHPSGGDTNADRGARHAGEGRAAGAMHSAADGEQEGQSPVTVGAGA